METPLLQSLTTPIIAFFVCLMLRAVFSFLETSITALRLFKLKELAASTKSYHALFQTLEKNPHRVLITILIANNLADVTTAALATNIMESIFAHLHLSSSLGFSLGIGIATLAILIFGEIIPKNFAKGRGDRLFKSSLWLTNILFYIFYPVVTLLISFSDSIVAKISGDKSIEGGGEWVSSEREIQFLIRYIYEKGLIEAEKTEMLQNIFELGRTPVREIMVPATDIISVSAKSTIKETLNVFLEHHFSRLPVYQDNKDNVIGMVHLKDVFAILSSNQNRTLVELVRPILFVPESVKVNQLLREFREQHMHIAMVLNEHGIITGLITLEDVLEEIVGEISDEHEPAIQKITPLKQGGWLVDASTPLEELSEFLNITFETEDALTLGGFITEQLQHLPKKGERLLYQNFYFQIQKASQKRVLQVLIFEDKNQKSIPTVAEITTSKDE
jgi:putative hemolysin